MNLYKDSIENIDSKMELRKIIPALLIILTVFGCIHWFLFLTVSRSLTDVFWLKVIYILGLFSMPLGFLSSRSVHNRFSWLTWAGYVWMGFFNIHILFSTLEFGLLFFVHHNYSYWVLLATLLCSVWALYKGSKFPDLITHQILGPAEIKNFKIVQISDVHMGMLHINTAWLEKIVQKINQQQPDVIAITGDLIDGNFAKISEMLEPLKNLKSKYGHFYITGNHEYIHPGQWETQLESLGISILHNQNKLIEFNDQKILIAGVPDRMAPRFHHGLVSDPDLALKNNENPIYKILLAHQPASIRDLKNEKCDLMLTGHTHGGQIFPFQLAVLLQQPMVQGFKKFGSTLVFNHQGTGFWGPPMRWFSRSEIVTLIFK